MDLRRAGILIVMDVLLLAELVFAIWLSHFDRASIAYTFMLAFLPAAVPTVIGARMALKRLGRIQAREGKEAYKYRPVSPFISQDNQEEVL